MTREVVQVTSKCSDRTSTSRLRAPGQSMSSASRTFTSEPRARARARFLATAGPPNAKPDANVILGKQLPHAICFAVLLHQPLPVPPIGELLSYERLVCLGQVDSRHGGNRCDDRHDIGHVDHRLRCVVKVITVRSPGIVISEYSTTRSLMSIEVFRRKSTETPGPIPKVSASSGCGGRAVNSSIMRSTSMPTV